MESLKMFSNKLWQHQYRFLSCSESQRTPSVKFRHGYNKNKAKTLPSPPALTVGGAGMIAPGNTAANAVAVGQDEDLPPHIKGRILPSGVEVAVINSGGAITQKEYDLEQKLQSKAKKKKS